jgi:hypothetical protein
VTVFGEIASMGSYKRGRQFWRTDSRRPGDVAFIAVATATTWPAER